MLLKKDKQVLQNFQDAIQYEWLETNGLGGWSSSTLIGAHTRRYHGLLVAAIKPPTGRMVLLSKLDETIVTDNARMELGCNLYNEDVVHPEGYRFLQSFSKKIFPEWIYRSGAIEIKKTIAMLHGENTVIVMYDVLRSPAAFTLELLPLVAARGYHSLEHESDRIHWDVNFENGTFYNQPDGNVNLYVYVPGSSYRHNPAWFKNFTYGEEKERGLDYTEDLLNHGVFSVELKEGDSLGIIISTENTSGKNACTLFKQEEKRRKALLKGQSKDALLQQLVLAADQFIVKRSDDLKTVIAGYHWFTDWGRDTMIALPGLTLSTGRFEDAKKILAAFAQSVSMGMLPNRFQEKDPPEYNNVDGTLWYFIAIKKYLDATGDKIFILNELLPVLKIIIDWHFKGTRYHIHMDDDGLLYAGEKGQQLTWMDARVGDWVVTPRMGKPVEIQALWYNALKIFSELLILNNELEQAAAIEITAAKTKQCFNDRYWYAAGGYLYDNIDENNISSTELRPNQLFALSLPYVLIDDTKKAKAVLKAVEINLYTPVGLRSLSPGDIHYISGYKGDQWHRDAAYHQGTVWSWLLGPYIDALVKLKTKKPQIKKLVDDFAYHLEEGCIGSVSEIFDAAAPHSPKGCVAQAWGVAEILRVMKEYELFYEKKAAAKKRRQFA
ncbi:MAG: amylo-alpha-1,6-glucosidase [Ferruginibacter sp.]